MNPEIELPNIFGKFSSESFIELIKKINDAQLNYEEIESFHFYPSGRWDIKIKNNIIIKLPKNNLELAFMKINKIIKSDKIKNIKIIDLRIPSRLIISNE